MEHYNIISLYFFFFYTNAPSLPVVLITTFGSAAFSNDLFSRVGYSDLARTVNLNDLDRTSCLSHSTEHSKLFCADHLFRMDGYTILFQTRQLIE